MKAEEKVKKNKMLLLFLSIFVIGFGGYAVFASLWIRYVFAHIGGLAVIGLFGCWSGALARKKGYCYWRAFFLGFLPPIILGIISVFIIHALGGHGCGGIVSLFFAVIVVFIYELVKKKAVYKTNLNQE